MNMFSSHGLSIPTQSPRKQSHGDPPGSLAALSDVHDRMERGSDSSEGGGINSLDDGDDDGRRLI